MPRAKNVRESGSPEVLRDWELLIFWLAPVRPQKMLKPIVAPAFLQSHLNCPSEKKVFLHARLPDSRTPGLPDSRTSGRLRLKS